MANVAKHRGLGVVSMPVLQPNGRLRPADTIEKKATHKESP